MHTVPNEGKKCVKAVAINITRMKWLLFMSSLAGAIHGVEWGYLWIKQLIVSSYLHCWPILLALWMIYFHSIYVLPCSTHVKPAPRLQSWHSASPFYCYSAMGLPKLLCLPPSVTGEVYCFPRRHLILSFGRRLIYHSKGLWEYISKSIPSDTTIFKRIRDFVFILNIWCYTSMDSSQQALQNNGKLFPNLKFVFEILTENKNKMFKRIARCE